jgi:RNA polymerase sigma-70 factor (ECF subfamily)
MKSPGGVNPRASGRNREAMDDYELIAAVAGGDDTALRELFTRHAPWLSARLRAVLPAAEVEDVLQETFLAAWRGARRYRPDGPVGGWLWGIARRQAALWLRRRGPAGLPLPAAVAGDGLHPAGPGNLASHADPARSADLADEVAWRADLACAVSALGPEGGAERETWRLMYVEDRSVAEVAALMGVPAGTVKSRAHRARRLMRAALRQHEPVQDGGER